MDGVWKDGEPGELGHQEANTGPPWPFYRPKDRPNVRNDKSDKRRTLGPLIVDTKGTMGTK